MDTWSESFGPAFAASTESVRTEASMSKFPQKGVAPTPPWIHHVDRHDVLGGLIHGYYPAAA